MPSVPLNVQSDNKSAIMTYVALSPALHVVETHSHTASIMEKKDMLELTRKKRKGYKLSIGNLTSITTKKALSTKKRSA
jgi:hypothetical protein